MFGDNFASWILDFEFPVVSLQPTKPKSTSAKGAEIAQVVERFTRNEKDAGSSPAFGSGKTKEAFMPPLSFHAIRD